MDFDRLKSRLPRANQSFPFLRTHHKIYVDKTRFIRSLAMDNEPKFLSRPRRFGKSTLVSTLEELFTLIKQLVEHYKKLVRPIWFVFKDNASAMC